MSQTLLIDCQADRLDHLDRRFVVPLLSPEVIPGPISRLHPQCEAEGRQYVMATHIAASVPVRSVGRRVTTLNHERDRIAAALDMLLVGF